MHTRQHNYKLRMVLLFVVVIGAIVWFPVALMSKTMHPMLRVVVGIIGVLGIFSAFDRDLWLPFLGEAVVPASLLVAPTVQGGVGTTTKSNTGKPGPEDVIVSLTGLPASTKVVYWAAENGDPRTRDSNVVTWKEAYGSYANSGVVESDVTGRADIMLHCPQQYTVSRFGFKKTLPRHVHYRYAIPGSKGGLLSKVYTHYFTCGRQAA